MRPKQQREVNERVRVTACKLAGLDPTMYGLDQARAVLSATVVANAEAAKVRAEQAAAIVAAAERARFADLTARGERAALIAAAQQHEAALIASVTPGSPLCSVTPLHASISPEVCECSAHRLLRGEPRHRP